MRKKPKIVTIGGGTGTFTVLSGLKKYPVDLTAIVTMADSGGSTGRLRDEFGYLPVGDVRMALVALAEEGYQSNLLRRLFLYRFDKGEKGLQGHNFGNLFLVALEDIMGSQERALQFASHILHIQGTVVPITTDDIQLVAQYEDGSLLKGETHIDEPPSVHDLKLRITQLSSDPVGTISRAAKGAIEHADSIVMGPGDLYTSQLANVVIEGVPEAIQKNKGTFIFILNLMTKPGQTHGFSAQDHLDEIEKYVGRKPDVVLMNNAELPQDILAVYEKSEGAFPVIDDLPDDTSILRNDYIDPGIIEKRSGDVLKRSLLRHDSEKLAKAVIDLVENNQGN